jgi:hypothetical protein
MALRREAIFVIALACCDDVVADEGRDAALTVVNAAQDGAPAQFVRDDWPSRVDGPSVNAVTVGSVFAAGTADRSLIGEIGREGRAVAIALSGDLGYWIVPAGLPAASAAGSPTFTTGISFSPRLASGSRQLLVRAVDEHRRFGPIEARTIEITAAGTPDGELVIALVWDTGADLDLHVVDPRGVEVFARNISSYEPGPTKEAPGTPHDGGVLDIDSNAGCVADGRRSENVVWLEPPPAGHYVVRVDTFSMCDEDIATWRASAWLRGERLAAREGVSTQADVRFSHDRGAGVLAFELDVR